MTPKNHPSVDGFHYHVKPSSVLRSFMHKRTASEGGALSSNSVQEVFDAPLLHDTKHTVPLLPYDHPHSRPLGEIHQNQQTQPLASPRKSREEKHHSAKDDGHRSLHKKTLSSISLKSLAGRDTGKALKAKDKTTKPNKAKKATNLSSLLSRPKSSKSLRKEAAEQDAREQKDKENQGPHASIQSEISERPPPIYAQFSSVYFANQPSGGRFLEDEIDLYTPQEYSPGKQRNFCGGPGRAPTLGRDTGSQRPKSTYLPSSFSIQDISRRISGGSPRDSSELTRKVSSARKSSLDWKTPQGDKAGTNQSPGAFAAVSALSAKPKILEPQHQTALEEKDVNLEFEAMLDRRNIPEHQRGKMRSLTMMMKRDFIKQDCAETSAAKTGRHETNSGNSSADTTTASIEQPEEKSKRPRSRTFTLSRGTKEPSSPTKKSKPLPSTGRHSRTNSSDSAAGGNNPFVASGAGVAQTLIAKAKGQLPDDFVSYLRKVQKPESVEVGRLHKLRILLRNETVSWTDGFIGLGGMEEIVGLLHRTMEVEWRYVACIRRSRSLLTVDQRGA